MLGKLPTLVIALVIAGAAFGFGYFTGKSGEAAPFSHTTGAPSRTDDLRQFAFVQDAIQRWADKDGISVEQAMHGRSIVAIPLSDRTCIQFQLDPISIGGEPVYCYRNANSVEGTTDITTDLIYEDSNVE